MINLKRNDKLIIIIAVIIIIISGIGIAAYNPPSVDEKEMLPIDEKIYTVDWEKKTNSYIISDSVGKNAPYNETYTVDTPMGSVITNVDFQIIWEDDQTIGLIIKRGLDTLTVEIDPTYDAPLTYEGTGSGNETLSFNVNSAPNFDTIQAEDMVDAEQIIYNESVGKDTASFDITVSVKTGEPLRRPLRYLMDNGNDFEIEITYDYYIASMMEDETKETSGNNDLEEIIEEEYTPPYLSMIIGTGCGRYI
jgi:hypothetical protein